MKKDEIIQLDRVMKDNKELLQRIDALLERISSLEEALLQKGESLDRQKRINKGLTKIVSNKSEPDPPSQEELKALEEERESEEEQRSQTRHAL